MIQEALLHNLSEYMDLVEDRFERLDMRDAGQKKTKRRIFLASDEPNVLEEAKRSYSDYEILGDPAVIEAAGVSSRGTRQGLMGALMDIFTLAHCDFVVCTFSSNVCRLVYELKMAVNPLGYHDEVLTLDAEYYLVDPPLLYRQAVLPHVDRSNQDNNVDPRDMIWDASFYDKDRSKGWIRGRNEKTGRSVRVPRFKLQEFVNVQSFPIDSDGE